MKITLFLLKKNEMHETSIIIKPHPMGTKKKKKNTNPKFLIRETPQVPGLTKDANQQSQNSVFKKMIKEFISKPIHILVPKKSSKLEKRKALS